MDEAGPWVACQEMGAQALARLSVSFQGWVLEEGQSLQHRCLRDSRHKQRGTDQLLSVPS